VKQSTPQLFGLIQADIYRWRGLGDPAHRNKINAGFRDFPDRLEGDAP
jgi:hypothetical protein